MFLMKFILKSVIPFHKRISKTWEGPTFSKSQKQFLEELLFKIAFQQKTAIVVCNSNNRRLILICCWQHSNLTPFYRIYFII